MDPTLHQDNKHRTRAAQPFTSDGEGEGSVYHRGCLDSHVDHGLSKVGQYMSTPTVVLRTPFPPPHPRAYRKTRTWDSRVGPVSCYLNTSPVTE